MVLSPSTAVFPRRARSLRRGFTILEVLVSAVLLLIVSLISYSIISSISSAWRTHKARLSTFEGARVGFELLTNRLSQATLNTYWDYDDPANPTRYLRRSELHFNMGRGATLLPDLPGVTGDAVFFLAPLGFTSTTGLQPLTKMLTACGFYIRFSSEVERPDFLDARIPVRFRYRLMQFLQPGENLAVYDLTPDNETNVAERNRWFTDHVADHSFPMIDNVIGLILRANYPVGNSEVSEYSFDSRNGTRNAPTPSYHQLPPSISVTMVVIDEDSARRLAEEFGATAPPLQPPPSNNFTNADNYDADLQAWETLLREITPGINYRIFTADVPIRGAKWSSD